MILFYTKILDVENDDYVFENPVKNIWALIKNGVTLKELPTKNDLIQYRQCMFSNESFVQLVDIFKSYIEAPYLFYFLAGYLNEDNKEDLLDIVIQSLKWSKILIYFDICADKDDTYWDTIKKEFINLYPDDYTERIFKYSDVIKDMQIQIKIKEKLSI